MNDLPANATGGNGNTLTAVIDTEPTGGTLSPNGSGFIYAPNTGFTGADSFTYHVSDGTNSSASAMVAITVGSSNPLIANPVLLQSTGQPMTIAPSSLLLNAQSASGKTLTLCSYTDPANGTLQYSGGNLVYTPTAAGSRFVYV